MNDVLTERIRAFLCPLAERWRDTKVWHSMAPDNSAWFGEIHITVRDLKEASDLLELMDR